MEDEIERDDDFEDSPEDQKQNYDIIKTVLDDIFTLRKEYNQRYTLKSQDGSVINTLAAMYREFDKEIQHWFLTGDTDGMRKELKDILERAEATYGPLVTWSVDVRVRLSDLLHRIFTTTTFTESPDHVNTLLRNVKKSYPSLE